MRRIGVMIITLGLVWGTATVLAKAPQIKLDIRWQEKSGLIDHPSVCYNYPHRSVLQRRCKVAAKALFKDKCRYYQGRYRKTRHPYNQRFNRDVRRFCYAARQYNPL